MTAGTDTLKTRRTLSVGGKDYDYYSSAGGRGGRPGRPVPPALLPEGPAGEPAALRGRPLGHRRGHQGPGRLDQGAPGRPRDRLPPGPGPDAGLHRRAGGGRPGRDAQGHGGAGRRPAEDQPAVAGRPGDRPLGHGRRLRRRGRLREERRDGVRAQRRALRLPALGPDRLRQLPRRAAGHRHLPPGEPGVPGPGGLDQAGERQDRRLSRHPGRHRQPHHHGQRPGGAGLGRRRHRGRGRDAGPAGHHADPRGGRLQADRRLEGRRHGDRPGADRDPDAARQGRGRQVRRVLRPRARPPEPGRPGDHRNMAPEYGATCGFFPVDEETLRYLTLHRPRPRAHRPGRGLRQGPGHVARCGHAGPGLHRQPGARPRHGRALASPGPSGPQDQVRCPRRPRPSTRMPSRTTGTPGRSVRCRSRQQLRASARRRGDRRDHQLHQHLQPQRPGRRRPGRPEGARAGPDGQALGQDLASRRAPRWSPTTWRPRACRTDLDALGFDLVGYGCTTCIGNSGPLPEPIAEAIEQGDLRLRAVLSGNRNFEGRVNPHTRAQLPGLAAAGRGLRPGRHDEARPGGRSHRHRRRRQAGPAQGHLADQPGDPGGGRKGRDPRDVRGPLRQRLRGPRAVAGDLDQVRP